eukprot:jgi/Botrbrau1/15084/Bobra.0221s0003.1
MCLDARKGRALDLVTHVVMNITDASIQAAKQFEVSMPCKYPPVFYLFLEPLRTKTWHCF